MNSITKQKRIIKALEWLLNRAENKLEKMESDLAEKHAIYKKGDRIKFMIYKRVQVYKPGQRFRTTDFVTSVSYGTIDAIGQMSDDGLVDYYVRTTGSNIRSICENEIVGIVRKSKKVVS